MPFGYFLLKSGIKGGLSRAFGECNAIISWEFGHGELTLSASRKPISTLPISNALNFPTAILQPPFFDPLAPTAFNYGTIGSVIGHEISHTFDTGGSAFDSKGRVRNWWTPADLEHFEASTAKLAAQYDSYKAFPDLTVNGKQTLAENIADVAGISAAYDGYRASLAGKPAIESLSPCATTS